ncbi:MAG: hypothetical protein IKT29_00195 [Flavobacteriales bacterium]|nr:hypothetical protein [Flavobacteriales bacterium]
MKMISKKHILTLVVVVCTVMGMAAQPVMVERQGRAEHIKSYYAPEKGFTADVTLGYALALNGISNYASQVPTPSFELGLGYSFSKKWKAFFMLQTASMMEDKGYDRIKISEYEAVSGEKVHDVGVVNLMIGGEFCVKDFSQYLKPYVGLAVGMGSVKLSTEVSDQYVFEGKKWLPLVVPRIGLRGYLTRDQTVGYNFTVAYTQYLGDVETVDISMSMPSFLRIGAGVFVKFM